MSAFDDMIDAGLNESSEVFGRTSFVYAGKTYEGLLNEYAGEQEVELDGVLGTFNATLVCTKGQFRLLAKPLQKTLNNVQITIDSISYRVKRVAVDSASVTLGLMIAR